MALCLIYPPGLLECPLHCHQEYPGKITCLSVRPWIGGLGLLGMGCTGLWCIGNQWCMTIWWYFHACFSPPPLSKTSFLSLFLQQKTPGCSQPIHCHTTFRALLAWLDTHTCTHIPVYTFIIISTYFFPCVLLYLHSSTTGVGNRMLFQLCMWFWLHL